MSILTITLQCHLPLVHATIKPSVDTGVRWVENCFFSLTLHFKDAPCRLSWSPVVHKASSNLKNALSSATSIWSCGTFHGGGGCLRGGTLNSKKIPLDKFNPNVGNGQIMEEWGNKTKEPTIPLFSNTLYTLLVYITVKLQISPYPWAYKQFPVSYSVHLLSCSHLPGH